MTENEAKTQRGRKPIAGKAMTAAERMQRRESKLKEQGVRTFRMRVAPLHMEWIEAAAARQGIAVSAVLGDVLERALDRYTGVMARAKFLEVNCGNVEAAADFVSTQLVPPLPSFDELAAQFGPAPAKI